jgi:gas vesicle protein
VLRAISPYATVSVEVAMADNVGSKVSYFLVGLGVGALVGVLFAPKSGEETRNYLSNKADEGKDYAQRKARELRERADELIERSKDVAVRKKDSLSAAVEAGREAYLRESSKA